MPITSMDDAVAAVRPPDRLAIPLGPGIPGAFLHALGERDDFEQLEVFGALLTDLYAVFTKPGVRLLSGFYGPAERFLRDSGANVEFVPSDFRRFTPDRRAVPPAGRRRRGRAARRRRLDEPLAALGRGVARAAADHRRPRAHHRRRGVAARSRARSASSPSSRTGCTSTRSSSSSRPTGRRTCSPTRRRRRSRRAIAEHVQPFIRSGATLQTGIGGIPSMVVQLLANGDAGDFGVHSEMFTTGLMELHQAGQGHATGARASTTASR